MSGSVVVPDSRQAEVPDSASLPALWLVIVAHALLGGFALLGDAVTLVHAGTTLLLGLYFALAPVPVSRVLVVAAYIASSEVFWRLTDVPLNWEFGKYSVILLCVVAILRRGIVRAPLSALLYGSFLAISVPLTFASSVHTLRESISDTSFNMSGPLAMTLCIWLGARASLTSRDVRHSLTAITGPAVACVAVVLVRLGNASTIRFTQESNFTTSGGFGPNQVSASLAFGALAAVLAAAITRRSIRLTFLLVALVAFVHSVMTFSRTGLYLLVGSALAAGTVVAGTRRVRPSVLVALLIVTGLTVGVIAQILDTVTEGNLLRRFSNTDSENRTSIMADELEVFFKHPVLGVGPGRAHPAGPASHTEYTRMLAEHGLGGLVALLTLLALPAIAIVREREVWRRAIQAAFFTFGVLFLLPSGMRLVMPAVCFSLGLAVGSQSDRRPTTVDTGSRLLAH